MACRGPRMGWLVAIATVVAQYGAASTLARPLLPNRQAAAGRSCYCAAASATLTPETSSSADPTAAVPAHRIANTRGDGRMDELWSTLALGQVARCANFAQVTAVATSGGAIAAAAHQVSMGLFYATLPFGDAVSQTAQAFLPAVVTPAARHNLRIRLAKLGAFTGLLCALLTALPLLVPALTRAFTSNIAISTAIITHTRIRLCVCLDGLAAEGVLIAGRDLRPVAWLSASPSSPPPCASSGRCTDRAPCRASRAAFTTFHVTRFVVFGEGRGVRPEVTFCKRQATWPQRSRESARRRAASDSSAVPRGLLTNHDGSRLPTLNSARVTMTIDTTIATGATIEADSPPRDETAATDSDAEDRDERRMWDDMGATAAASAAPGAPMGGDGWPRARQACCCRNGERPTRDDEPGDAQYGSTSRRRHPGMAVSGVMGGWRSTTSSASSTLATSNWRPSR